jgi:cobaltochelatase CobT
LLEERRRRYYIGGYKSGKLNSKSLFSVKCGNDRIFKKRNEVRDINAAVSLLIDMSGSMSGEKIHTAMQSAYAFAMTLQQLKVPYEIYGFVTENHNYEMEAEYKKFIKANPTVEPMVVNSNNPERIYAFKNFDENFDIVCKTAMTGAAGNGCNMIQNEDSKHVMLALKRLSVRPEKVKALFVFSDGMPAYHFYDCKRSYDQLKFLADNAKFRYGVDCYSIGIQSECVSKFYKQYKVIKQITELPSSMFDFLRKVFG